ncbi:alpha-crystallin A chain-like [Bacillus rossius redtenbacheri]|uniref:alpha-crystallin A chain-like n=1 Tax=Bacillus rossius redtenbacheri TaxID=93214 RepID=UPI002FDCBC9C
MYKMSLAPYYLSEVLDELQRPASLFDQNFGLGMLAEDLVQPRSVGPLRIGYYRPWRHQASRQSGVSNLLRGKEGFKVNLDVQQFKPEEVSVKVVDNCVVVEGKHEERQDEHGYISRQFTRRYALPDNVDTEQLLSSLSSDGVLTVAAPLKPTTPPPANERVIPIVQTQAPAVKQAPSGAGDAKGKDGDKMEQ